MRDRFATCGTPAANSRSAGAPLRAGRRRTEPTAPARGGRRHLAHERQRPRARLFVAAGQSGAVRHSGCSARMQCAGQSVHADTSRR
ncbi:unnamed protein product [Mycetohabitans rhizoxinica HKI 454]|uniref:Uncharacterized protein n=1 Tax=Mycetohabitans rhizoxinica (strain DSM 19002 / CIP 109453 / HKI 454) TaxID=882378 RepID=E5ALM5_MYCRK|nr:unnamed protein product [Mycetohabitans rhizoxinica HKI 454]